MTETQLAIDDLEAYMQIQNRDKNPIDQKNIGQEKNNLLRHLTGLINNFNEGQIKSLFMEKLKNLYTVGSSEIKQGGPGYKQKRTLDPDFFYSVKNELLKAKVSSEEILKNRQDKAFKNIFVKSRLLKEKVREEEILKNIRAKLEQLSAKVSAGGSLDKKSLDYLNNEFSKTEKNLENLNNELLKTEEFFNTIKEPKQRFIVAFKEKTLSPLLDAIKKSIISEKTNPENFYPVYTPEQIISTFFTYKFSTREAIKTLLNELQILNPQMINKESLNLF